MMMRKLSLLLLAVLLLAAVSFGLRNVSLPVQQAGCLLP